MKTTNSYTTAKEVNKARNVELITGAIFFGCLLIGLLLLINLIPSTL